MSAKPTKKSHKKSVVSKTKKSIKKPRSKRTVKKPIKKTAAKKKTLRLKKLRRKPNHQKNQAEYFLI